MFTALENKQSQLQTGRKVVYAINIPLFSSSIAEYVVKDSGHSGQFACWASDIEVLLETLKLLLGETWVSLIVALHSEPTMNRNQRTKDKMKIESESSLVNIFARANNCLRHCFPGFFHGENCDATFGALVWPEYKVISDRLPPTLHNTCEAHRSFYILIFWKVQKRKCWRDLPSQSSQYDKKRGGMKLKCVRLWKGLQHKYDIIKKSFNSKRNKISLFALKAQCLRWMHRDAKSGIGLDLRAGQGIEHLTYGADEEEGRETNTLLSSLKWSENKLLWTEAVRETGSISIWK